MNALMILDKYYMKHYMIGNMKNEQYQIMAKAIRVESNPDTGELFLVFEVMDEDLKKRIKTDWLQDIELKLIGKNLIKNEEK